MTNAVRLVGMSSSTGSIDTKDTVLSISGSLDFDSEDDSDFEEEKTENEKEENTDCSVYIATVLMVIACVVVVFTKVTVLKRYEILYL